MGEREACQSYRRNGNVCADGFIQKPFCRGYGGCDDCGHISERSLPNCLTEDIPARWLKEDGSPLFYREVPHD